MENLPQLEILNDVKIHTKKKNSRYSPKHMTSHNIENINQDLEKHFDKILEFENTYLDDVDNQASS